MANVGASPTANATLGSKRSGLRRGGTAPSRGVMATLGLASLEARTAPTAAAVARRSVRAHREWRRRSNRLLIDLFFDLLDRYGVEELVECGANEASASIRFVGSADERRAIAVEANPQVHRELTVAAERFGVETVCVALGSSVGRASLSAPGSGSLAWASKSSLLPREWSGSGAGLVQFDVAVTTIDRLLTDRAASCRALWIDVEGFGAEVLAGAQRTLRDERCAAVLIEVESREFWPNQTLASGVAEVLAGHGFVAVARDSQFGEQYNVIFVRNDLVDSGAERLRQFEEHSARAGTALITVLFLRSIVRSVRSRFRRMRAVWTGG